MTPRKPRKGRYGHLLHNDVVRAGQAIKQLNEAVQKVNAQKPRAVEKYFMTPDAAAHLEARVEMMMSLAKVMWALQRPELGDSVCPTCGGIVEREKTDAEA